MGRSIALTGMMGSGKSSVGRELASLIDNYTLIETDEEIAKIEKMSINEIFSQKGEDYFRKAETGLLKKYSEKEKLIISTGGGMFLKKENRELLKNAFTVYLSASPQTLFERIKNDNSRPLLHCEKPEEKISALLKEREKFYKLADIEISTENKIPEQIANEILEMYKNYEKQN